MNVNHEMSCGAQNLGAVGAKMREIYQQMPSTHDAFAKIVNKGVRAVAAELLPGSKLVTGVSGAYSARGKAMQTARRRMAVAKAIRRDANAHPDVRLRGECFEKKVRNEELKSNAAFAFDLVGVLASDSVPGVATACTIVGAAIKPRLKKDFVEVLAECAENSVDEQVSNLASYAVGNFS